MQKQTITYTDFNDVERTEDFYFNLTATELLELNKSIDGGFETALANAVKTEDVLAVYALIQKTILAAIGQKSEDGRFFKKTPEYTAEFEASAAYQGLLDDFLNHPDRANAFVTGILPKEMRAKVAQVDQAKAMESLLSPAT